MKTNLFNSVFCVKETTLIMSKSQTDTNSCTSIQDDSDEAVIFYYIF